MSLLSFPPIGRCERSPSEPCQQIDELFHVVVIRDAFQTALHFFTGGGSAVGGVFEEHGGLHHVWNAMPPHRPQVLSTFLGRITRHFSIDIYRRRTSAKRCGSEYALSLDEMSDCVPGKGSPEEALDAEEMAGHINRFLQELA